MKKDIRSGLLAVFMLPLFLLSCKGKPDRGNILEYAVSPESGMRKEVEIDRHVYKFQYKPAAYMLKSEGLSGQELAEREKQLDSMVWFNISLSIKDFPSSPLRYGIKGIEEYNERLDYYLNRAAGDISLVYGKDTLRAYSYWFENNQNLSPEETIVVGFKLKDAKVPVKDLHLAFYDRVFQNGIVKTVIRPDPG